MELVAEQKITRIGPFEKRVHEIDLVRGLLILLVVMDHIFNNFMLHSGNWIKWFPDNPAMRVIFDVSTFYWDSPFRALVRYIALFLFCFVSGISSQFSRNNWKRSAQLLVVWGVLLVGGRLLKGWGLLPGVETRIDFNIIGVLAFSTLFYCFVQNCSFYGLFASTLIWFFLSCFMLPFIEAIPGSRSVYNPVLFDFRSTVPQADWMPLMPYIFFFFLGACFSYFYYRNKKSHFVRHEWERSICFVGRNTIWIYLGHQVVFIPLFYLIDVILKAAYGIL